MLNKGTKNILVWGSGFIGSHLNYEHIKSRAVSDPSIIRSILAAYKADVIINCIGYCGVPNIDACETNKERTLFTNTIIPSMIAAECDKMGIHHVMIGSGCIFSGFSPNAVCSHCIETPSGCGCEDELIVEHGWKETDAANPVSYYSNTKYACDLLISSLPTTTVLRIRMPISSKNDPRNFISKVKGYQNIINIPNSVTFTSDLTKCIDWCIDNHKTGIYNVVNPEPLTAVQVMNEFQKHFPTHQFNIISEKQLGLLTKAKRSNCILDGSKLKNEGFIMSPSKEALSQTMKEYVKNMEKYI